jgi:molecular chaperone GrpE
MSSDRDNDTPEHTPIVSEETSPGDASDGPESPEAVIERLRGALAAKTEEAEQNHDRYLRERAELENVKKRLQREKIEAIRFANESLLRDLLPVLDNLERAITHAESGGNGQPLVEGVRLILRNALDVLERHGVSRVEAQGEPFDPSRHEAIARVPGGAIEPNRVVEQFLPGYRLHDRLLRAAQVSVAAEGAVEKPQDDD